MREPMGPYTHMQVLGTKSYEDYTEALTECQRLLDFTGRSFTPVDINYCMPHGFGDL